MTVAPWVLVWIVAAPLLLGVLTLRALGLSARDDRLGYAAWVGPAGCLALAAALVVYLVLDVEPTFWWTAPPFAALLLALVGLRARRPSPVARVRRSGDAALLAFVAAGAVVVLVFVVAAASQPCLFADEGNIWSLKAKSLWFDWYRGEFGASQRFSVHPDYPLLNPLLQAWVYSQAGAIVHFENRLLLQVCALSLWLASAAALRRRLPAWAAALLLVPLLLDASFFQVCRNAYSDGLVALGLVLALDGWLRAGETPQRGHHGLCALGLAVAIWAKNEALLYTAAAAAAAVVVVLVRRRRPRLGAGARWAALPLGVVALQVLWNRHFDLHNDLWGRNPTGRSLLQLLVEQWNERAGPVLGAAADLLLSCQHAHTLLLLPFVAAVIVPRAAIGGRLAVPTIALAASVVGMHLVYVGSWLELGMHIQTSQARVLFQLVPGAAVWLAALWQDAWAAPSLRR